MNQAELLAYFQMLGLKKVMRCTYRSNNITLFANTHQLQVRNVNAEGYYKYGNEYPYPISIETLREILL